MKKQAHSRFFNFRCGDLKSTTCAGLGRSVFILTSFVLATLLLKTPFNAAAQQAKVERVGVLHLGGVLATVVDGLRAGLKELGLEEGKQVALEIHDLKGDAKAAESVAQKFERDKVRLIFTNTVPVTAGAIKGTKTIPIVFTVGADPVAQGFIKSFAQPGGRLTGIQYLARDLTAKRLEILKEFLPKLRQIVTFYDPGNPVSVEGAKLGREEARRLNLKFVERKIKSIDELNAALDGIKAREFDAYLYVGDPMVVSQAQRIVDSALAKKLPTMFHDQIVVARGALASYGQSYFEIGRRAAKYVQRVLNGTPPGELRVETIDDVELAFNLATAKKIGVTIPPNVLVRAAKVIR
jgi:putative ABC transport system substrate-binding protein